MPKPRKPTFLKLVTGTAQPCRSNPQEPKPARHRPAPAAHLSAPERAAWQEIAAAADGLRVLSEGDALALEAAAGALADLRAARASLALPMVVDGKDGPVTLAEGGQRSYWAGKMRRQRPEIADIADAERRLGAWLGRFGLTPADRSRVSAAPDGGGNPFADLDGA
jgi:phage terminase small subunit